MKIHALMIAVALAAGSAFAMAANEGAGMGPNGATATTVVPAASVKTVAMRHHRHHRRHMHARMERREHMARMERMERHERLASRNSTRTMGAGRYYSPSVDLNSPARERRMDSAYNDWLRTHRR